MLADQTRSETISLTPEAVSVVRDLLKQRNLEGYALRVFVTGGGCSGYQYGMSLDNQVQETDITFDFDGVKVIVDNISIYYLQGAKVGYINSEKGSGFSIENPNAAPSCGCSPGDSCDCS